MDFRWVSLHTKVFNLLSGNFYRVTLDQISTKLTQWMDPASNFS